MSIRSPIVREHLGKDNARVAFYAQNFQHKPYRLGIYNSATERIAADHNMKEGNEPLSSAEMGMLNARVNSMWVPAEKVRTDHPSATVGQNPRHYGRFINIF